MKKNVKMVEFVQLQTLVHVLAASLEINVRQVKKYLEIHDGEVFSRTVACKAFNKFQRKKVFLEVYRLQAFYDGTGLTRERLRFLIKNEVGVRVIY